MEYLMTSLIAGRRKIALSIMLGIGLTKSFIKQRVRGFETKNNSCGVAQNAGTRACL